MWEEVPVNRMRNHFKSGIFLSHPEAKKKIPEGRETSINKEEKARKTPHISLHFVILK